MHVIHVACVKLWFFVWLRLTFQYWRDAWLGSLQALLGKRRLCDHFVLEGWCRGLLLLLYRGVMECTNTDKAHFVVLWQSVLLVFCSLVRTQWISAFQYQTLAICLLSKPLEECQGRMNVTHLRIEAFLEFHGRWIVEPCHHLLLPLCSK